MPRCNSEAMNMHLEEISFHVAPGTHAVLLLDQAGGMVRRNWLCPTTSPCCRFRPDAPNSTRSRTVWQFMRDNWLSMRTTCDTRSNNDGEGKGSVEPFNPAHCCPCQCASFHWQAMDPAPGAGPPHVPSPDCAPLTWNLLACHHFRPEIVHDFQKRSGLAGVKFVIGCRYRSRFVQKNR